MNGIKTGSHGRRNTPGVHADACEKCGALKEYDVSGSLVVMNQGHGRVCPKCDVVWDEELVKIFKKHKIPLYPGEKNADER
jgi:hypothetical protein